MNQDYEAFKMMIFRYTGINLSLYKEEQMLRWLNTLRVKRGMPSFVAYFQAMQTSNELLAEFLSRMTINVTEFFRNRPRWQVLEEKMHELAAKKQKLAVWSAACSSGEEPYSLGIMLRRFLPVERFTILATDLDREVLGRAEQGRYPEQAVAALTEKERQRYFTKEGAAYVVDRQLRHNMRFQSHDLLKDPAPGRFDLIVCRNVLIYFTEDGKSLIYRKLSDALYSDGVLFVGSTEQIFHPENYKLEPAGTFFYTVKK
ncbi:MAG: protein-glutamate O-methyltransferase CheR [Sporolactobacillus sp.]